METTTNKVYRPSKEPPIQNALQFYATRSAFTGFAAPNCYLGVDVHVTISFHNVFYNARISRDAYDFWNVELTSSYSKMKLALADVFPADCLADVASQLVGAAKMAVLLVVKETI